MSRHGYVIPQSVRVTDHAITRFKDRVQNGLSRERVVKIICCDISEAIRSGRVAKRPPRWCNVAPEIRRAKRAGKDWTRGKLVVWNLDETRAYSVVRQDNGRRLVVVTVYKRRSDD